LRGHGRGSSLPRLRQGGLRVFHDTLSVASEDIARSDLVVSDKAPADKLSSHGRSSSGESSQTAESPRPLGIVHSLDSRGAAEAIRKC